MILRAKTKWLFEGKPLTQKQEENSQLNISEIENSLTVLKSLPRRLVFELTNTCNLNCVMCGRNAADFKPTIFNMDWFNYFVPLLNTVEEVTLMGWGEPTIHPNFIEMLRVINDSNARKYFCTNGMTLDRITDALFEYNVDVFGVSLDGANPETNDKLRRGAYFEKITTDLRKIVKIRSTQGLKYPHINFVFCAMRSNLHELSKLVELAADIGIDEVKVVYLTTFYKDLLDEILWGFEDEIRHEFDKATKNSEKYNILLKLPHIPGSDPAGNNSHKECFAVYRDLFVGSDGFVRPCMSSSHKLFPLEINKNICEIWNSTAHQEYRKTTNVEGLMATPCKNCYQSSHCNWNKKGAFIQMGNEFSPRWE